MSKKITGNDLKRMIKEAFSTTGNPADQMDPLGPDQDKALDQHRAELSAADVRKRAELLQVLIDNISRITKSGKSYTIDGVSATDFKSLYPNEVNKVIAYLNNKSRTFKNLGIKIDDFKQAKKGSVHKTNSFNSGMSTREYKLINSELLKTKGLFANPWKITDPFPEELTTTNHPNEQALNVLKQAASINEPSDMLSDADLSGFILRRDSGWNSIKPWLSELVKETTSDSIRDGANSMLSKRRQGGRITADQSEFSKDVYKPDLSIKSHYRGQGNFQRPPKHIEEIFATFRGAFKSNTVKNRLEELNKIVVDFADNNLLEEVDRKDYKKLDKRWTAEGNDTSASDFSKLMVLDFFKQIANDMGRKTPVEAGSVFESFLALLVDGTVEGGTLDFDDVVAVDKDGTSLLSLKLLSTTTPVTQAEKTVRQFFEKYGKEAKIKYIVAYKDIYKEGEYNEFPIFMQDFTYNDIYKEDGSFKTDYDEVEGYARELETLKGFSGYASIAKDYTKFNKTPATYIPPGQQIFKTSVGNPDFVKDKEGKLQYPYKQKDVPSKQKLKKSSGAGTIVFGHKHIQKGESLGRIKIPKDPSLYDAKMKASFEAIDVSISEISKNLELFKSRITSFYASSNTTKRRRYANESYENAKNLQSLMDEHIFVQEPEPQGKVSGLEESKDGQITANFLKKLIQETLKK